MNLFDIIEKTIDIQYSLPDNVIFKTTLCFYFVHVDNNYSLIIWLLSLPFIATVAWSKNWFSWNTTAAEIKGKLLALASFLHNKHISL